MAQLHPYDDVANPGGAADSRRRGYLLRVYNYMAAGLAITGLVACYGAASGVYASLAGTPWSWLLLLAPLALVLLLSFRIERKSCGGTTRLLGVCGAGRAVAVRHFRGLHRPEHRAGVLCERRCICCHEPLRLCDASGSVALRVIFVHGSDRDCARDVRERVPEIVRAAADGVRIRRTRVRRPDSLRHPAHQQDLH